MNTRTKEKRKIDQTVASIGYYPMERVWFIDKEINGVRFRFYSIYKAKVEKYVRGKMKRMYRGWL